MKKEAKNITPKYTASGRAMRATSNGIFTINSPLRLNISTMVNRSAMSVIGEMNGTKVF